MLGLYSLLPAGFPYFSPTLQLTSCSPRPGRPASHSAVFLAPPGSRLPWFRFDCVAGTVQGYLGWQIPKTSKHTFRPQASLHPRPLLLWPFPLGACLLVPAQTHSQSGFQGQAQPLHLCEGLHNHVSLLCCGTVECALGRGFETWGPIPASVCASRKVWD